MILDELKIDVNSKKRIIEMSSFTIVIFLPKSFHLETKENPEILIPNLQMITDNDALIYNSY